MKYKPKTSLRAVFMSKEGISKHPTWHIMLLTPQTPHQHAVYNLVSQLAAQQTKMFRPRAAFDEKFANVERFNTKVMRMSELKCRHGCEVQNIHFPYRYGTFSIIFSTTDILQSRVSKIKEIENEERMREKDERSRNEGDDKIIEIVTLEGP